MLVSFKVQIAFCTLLTFVNVNQAAEYDVDAYCTLVKNGVRLASVEDCAVYYTCYNGKATKSTCPSGQSFDKDMPGCRPKSDVNCFIGNEQPCQGKTETFVPVLNTCDRYIYCKNNAEAGRGQCPYGMVFKNGNCYYGDCKDNINGSGEQGLTSACQVMPEMLFFGSSVNCEIWYYCSGGKLIPGQCTEGRVFDVLNAQCDWKSGNMCGRVTGIPVIPDDTPETICTKEQNGNKKADPAKCSAYQKCDGAYWKPAYCAKNEYFDPTKNDCVDRQKATPVKTCNRCEFSKQPFVNAVDPECRGYQVCQNGAKVGQNECPVDTYFDEWTQGCVMDKNGVERYAKQNGACKPDDSSTENECSKTCSDLSGDECKSYDKCNCGLDSGNCVFCENGTETDNTCKTNTCADKCKLLTEAQCKPAADCICGLTDSVCGECENGFDESTNQCGEVVDCSAVCEKATLESCKGTAVSACECEIHNGECKDCEASDCNGCICKDATAECNADTCVCFEMGDDCITCPNGSDDETECNPPN